ncbi:MAG: fumarylacetoacetate hydrolase family protein [Ktedonobacterales bacterium]|nr:fumarylacetoacetate hydrolase family protein [Ktedonobacterales bacterium]
MHHDDGIIDLTSHGFAGTMEDLITAWPQLHAGLQDLATQQHPTVLEPATLTLQAPVLRPSKILAVGMNYADHCREQGSAPPREPLVFANDISARDLQQRDGQWTRAKNFDTFCPLGPTLLTADAVPDPQDIPLTCQVNAAVMQASTTHEMIFTVAEILVHLSCFATLEPGDLVLTGTPRGVGAFRQPPISLQPGDQVQCTIPGIGTLTNPVVAWAPPHQEG